MTATEFLMCISKQWSYTALTNFTPVHHILSVHRLYFFLNIILFFNIGNRLLLWCMRGYISVSISEHQYCFDGGIPTNQPPISPKSTVSVSKNTHALKNDIQFMLKMFKSSHMFFSIYFFCRFLFIFCFTLSELTTTSRTISLQSTPTTAFTRESQSNTENMAVKPNTSSNPKVLKDEHISHELLITLSLIALVLSLFLGYILYRRSRQAACLFSIN